MSRSEESKVAPLADYHLVKDAVGNMTLQPPTDEQQRATWFRREMETWIELCRDAPDPVRVWFNVGPVEAEILLSFSRGNRSEPDSTVGMYARDTESGAWKKNHQGMAFARGGWLGDGHHRAGALVQSKKVIRVAIDFGVDDDAFDTVDMGRPRSIPDQIALRDGTKNTKNVVAALRMCMALTNGNATKKRSLAEVDRGREEHAKSLAALSRYIGARWPASFWGALLYAYPAAPEAVVALAGELLAGEGIRGAAYTLREYLVSRKRFTDQMVLAQHALCAVRAYIERRELARFRARDLNSVVQWFRSRRPAS